MMWRLRSWTIYFAMLTLAALLASCAGSRESTLQRSSAAGEPAPASPEVNPGFSLPAPAELASLLSAEANAQARSVSYLPADLFREAEDLPALLPNQNVSADSNGLSFSPDFSAGSADFSGLAFAIYGFRIDDYGGDSTLHFSWHGAAPPAGSAYIALANWGSDRWTFRTLGAESPLILPPLAPFFDEDDTLVAAVILTGSQDFELDWLRIGSLPPQLSLSADRTKGLTPFEVTFTASATDLDGSVVEYLWDPEGSGSFAISSGSEPELVYTYETPGDYLAAVRAVDNKGVYAEATAEMSPDNPINLISGTFDKLEFAASTIALPDGDLFCVGGQISPDFDERRAAVCRMGPTGELRFARLWGNGTSDSLSMALTGPEGFIYACGQTGANGSEDGLLQKWNPEGELLWSRSYGLIDAEEEFRSIALTADAIYACGYMRLDANFKYLGFVQRTDLDGNLIWRTSVIAPGDCFLQDTAYRSPGVADSGFVTVCGSYEVSASDSDALYATVDEASGSILQALRWGSDSLDEQANCVSVGGGPIIKPIFLSGFVQSGGGCFLGQPGGAVVTLQIAELSSLSGLDLLGQTLLASGSVLDIFTLESESRPVVMRFDSQLGILSAQQASAGNYFAAKLSRYNDVNLILSGSDNGGFLPQYASAEVTSTASQIAWVEVFPSTGTPQIQVLGTSLSVSAAQNWQLNPSGVESNMGICLGKF